MLHQGKGDLLCHYGQMDLGIQFSHLASIGTQDGRSFSLLLGRGRVLSPHQASTGTFLSGSDGYTCYFSPHGSTDITDGMASLLLSGDESPDFPLSRPLSPPQWGREGASLLHGKNGSPGSTYGLLDTVHRGRLYNLVEMKVLAPHLAFSDTTSTGVLGRLLTEW